MKCSEIQDLILTDYIDGEVNESTKRKIEECIEGCEECRAFFEAVQSTGSDPFEALERKTPSDNVWLNIKENITRPASEQKVYFLDTVKQTFEPFINFRMPAFVLTAVVLLFVMMNVFPINKDDNQVAYVHSEQELEYLAFLTDDEEEDDLGEYVEVIEEYFL